jgi:hypothetical protein
VSTDKLDPIERFNGPGGRHYKLWVQRDLFGDLVVFRSWGGEKSGRGGFKSITVCTDEQCEKVLHEVRSRRRPHGYVAVKAPNHSSLAG